MYIHPYKHTYVSTYTYNTDIHTWHIHTHACMRSHKHVWICHVKLMIYPGQSLEQTWIGTARRSRGHWLLELYEHKHRFEGGLCLFYVLFVCESVFVSLEVYAHVCECMIASIRVWISPTWWCAMRAWLLIRMHINYPGYSCVLHICSIYIYIYIYMLDTSFCLW